MPNNNNNGFLIEQNRSIKTKEWLPDLEIYRTIIELGAEIEKIDKIINGRIIQPRCT